MKYLLMIYANQQTWDTFSREEVRAGIAAQDAFNQELFESGELIGSFGLAPGPDARVVRVRSGVPAVTDGPYLESKEHLASSWLLEVASQERALQVAAGMPFAQLGGVEVWPVRHEAWPPGHQDS
jgi:hypothetical protein